MRFRQLIHAAQKQKKKRKVEIQSARMHLSILEYENSLPFLFATYATRLSVIPWATYQEKKKQTTKQQPKDQKVPKQSTLELTCSGLGFPNFLAHRSLISLGSEQYN